MQTLGGKVVARVAERCRAAGVECIAVGGGVDVAAAEALRRWAVPPSSRVTLHCAGYELAAGRA